MKKYVVAALTGLSALVAQAAFINGTPANSVGGFLTDSNIWSTGTFDNTENPTAGTSTGQSNDLIAGNRTIFQVSDFATFDVFNLGGTGSNVTGANLIISNGTFTANSVRINQNTANLAASCSMAQYGGTVNIGNLSVGLNASGEANFTVAGGALNVSNDVYFADGQAGAEHTFTVEGQDATSITVGGTMFHGAGTGDGFQNLVFKLGQTGITPLEVTGSLFADAQSEFIVDGADYTGGVQTITLATYANNLSGAGVFQTFINFNEYLPELIFANGELKLSLTINPNPELLADAGFEGLTGNEPNTNSAPWFTLGEEGGSPNFSVVPETVSTNVRTGAQAVKFNFYFDAASIAQTTEALVEIGESYEYSVWSLLTDPSANTLHTNSSTFNLSIWTSDNATSNFIYRIGQFGNIPTNVNEYQQFVYQFSTAQLIEQGASVGEYIQVRIAKANTDTEYRMVFDDVSLKGIDAITNSYALWSANWGVDIGSETADYDDDGLINIEEYGLGGNPTNGFVNGNLPVFGPDGSGFGYVYAQRSDDPTLVYYLETDLDLVAAPGWTNAGYTLVGTNVTGGIFDYVSNTVDTVEDMKFIRLKIEN